MKTMKKVLSVILVAVMLLTVVPLQGFVGLNISSLFASEAKAAGITDSNGETYWAMSHEEAINFIGFMYDKSKVTEDMINAGGVYQFLTGGFEKGTIEEYCAKLAFMETAKKNLSNCLSSYNQMADSAYQFLRDYFEDQLTAGSIAESAAWDIADKIVDYCDEIVQTYSEGSHSISSECLSLKNTYSNVSTAFDVIEALIVGLRGFNYIWSSSKKDMYTYISSYISNRSLKNSCSEAFDLINDYNKFALTDGFDYDFILDWASDDHIETLESFGDYIYFVSKSFNYNGSVFEPTDDLSEYKVIDVQCPTDIYVYNKDGELLLSIVDNEILNSSTNISASVYDNKKRVALPLSCEYDVVIKGTAEGAMDYHIYEIFNDSIMRTVEHNSVPLTEGCIYTSTIPVEVYTDVENYNITSETGEEIEADYDSLPPIQDNIVDVIVAEELFDGFPVEIIDLVADTMFNMQPIVDLSAYDISTDDAVALFSAVAKYYPAEYSLIANSDFTYKIIVSPNLDRIMKIRFYYGDDANLSTYQKRVKDLNAEIDALVAQVEGMNEFEKALYIHDYIVLHSEYDMELLEYMEANNCILPGEMYSEKYTEYSILVNGTGVCGSYALAYRAVLNAAGMECLYLSSREMNHAWNLVKIDGNWYHVDCCWDDPVPDTYGRARRTYFLRTDKEIMDLRHYSWSPGQYKATSELFSDMPRNYDMKQKYDDGKWYYLNGTSLYEADMYGNNETLLTSVPASSIDADGDSIYYSSGRYIYEYVTDTQETNLAYMLSSNDAGSKPADAYFSNIYVDGNTVEFYKTIYEDEYNRITVHDNDDLQKEKFASVTGITISQSEVTLDVFETLQLTAGIVTNGSADGMEVDWTSSDESIVRIDENGKITAANIGTATVTVRLFDFTATCDVTITGNGLSGLCGENVKWTFDTVNETLTLSGSGAMTSDSSQPWYSFRNEINTVIIEDEITSIGDDAFRECTSLTSVTIPDSVTSIGGSAFYNCDSLTSITIPDSVTNIDALAFDDCELLTAISVDEGNVTYSSLDGVLYNKDKTTLFYYPYGKTETDFIIPDSVTNVKNFAFGGCPSLTSITIGDSVSTIWGSTFSGCPSLTSVTIGDSVTNIHVWAFRDCISLTSITFGDSVTSIGKSAFVGCTSLTSVTIPDSVTSIGLSAFSGCDSLKAITVDADNAYYSSDEYGVLFNKDKTTLIQYPIGNERTSYSIPDSVTIIESSAFEDCTVLISVTIPDSVTSIGYYTFYNCESLFHIGYKGTEKDFSEIYIVSSNNCLLDASYIHYNFDPDTDIITLEAKAATCTENGFTKGYYCIDCQCYLEGEEIEATGHNYTLTERVAGTCTAEPYEVYTCSACGDSYIKEGKIEDGHKLAAEVIAPTCTEKGYTKEVCTVCGETMISEFTSPLGHSFIITRSADYCEVHGSITYECKNCDYTETIASDPANLVTETVVVEPTCTKSGTKSEICTLCGATVSTEILNPLSHDYAEEFTVDLEPTCTTAGRKSQHCTRCDAKRAVTEIEALGHTAETLLGADATCTETGLTEGKKCTVCGTVTVEQTVVPSLGHTEEIIPAVAATCTQTGLTEGKKCSVCGEVLVAQAVIDKTSHKPTMVGEKAATATQDGYTGDTVCATCGMMIEKGKVIPATGDSSGSGRCDHLCHKDGILGFFWKILRLFFKLFQINPVCECGAAHY